MKGFIRTLEVIIATILILGSLTYFFSSYIKPSEWPKAELQIQTQDILKSLDESGILRDAILNNNFTEIKQKLDTFMPESSRYVVEIEGIPKPKITVGCNCSEEDYERLKKILSSQRFEFEGRKVEINLFSNTSLDGIFNYEKAWGAIDVIVFFNVQNLSKYEKDIKNFLSSDKGILLISDLSKDQVTNFYSEIFNLSWNDTLTTSDRNKFNNNFTMHDKFTDYFTNVPFRVFTHNNTGGKFYISSSSSPFDINTYENATDQYVIFNNTYYSKGDFIYLDDDYGNKWKVKIVDLDASTYLGNETYVDLSIQNKTYMFVLEDKPNENLINSNEKTVLNDGASSFQVNYQITKYGNGRGMWIQNFNESYKDVDQLVKSSILWLAGEKYIMAKDVFERWYFRNYLSTARSFIKVHYLISGLLEPQPFCVNLIVWYVY